MPKKRRRSKPQAQPPEPVGPSRRKKAATIVLAVATVCVLGAAAYFVFVRSDTPSSPTTDSSAANTTRRAATLDNLLKMTPEQLAEVDIAEMNLLCATGLPGAEKLDIGHCLATLGRWAARVKHETDRHLYKFRQNPADYQNSEGYFRMLMLVTVLQQDFGVHYNKQRIRDVDFRRSQDLFIHGMIGDDNGGTCVSMPAIYTGVARRLGYSVKLVLTKSHTFCRWDAPNDRINIEGTNQGMNSFSDEYYLTWPDKVSEAEARHNRYLISLTPSAASSRRRSPGRDSASRPWSTVTTPWPTSSGSTPSTAPTCGECNRPCRASHNRQCRLAGTWACRSHTGRRCPGNLRGREKRT